MSMRPSVTDAHTTRFCDLVRDNPIKRGRPPLDPAARKRHNLTFRLRDALRIDLQAAALANGRSLSEEIEHRLELAAVTIPSQPPAGDNAKPLPGKAESD